jgi:hypothetical protein
MNSKIDKSEYDKQWYQEHKSEVLERQKRYRKINRAKISERRAVWRRKNKARLVKYRQDNKSKIFAAIRAGKLKTKIEVLTHYGSGACRCVKCGFPDHKALSIDHINGDGAADRRKNGKVNIYQFLKTRGYPSGYQTLCMNCQFIKRIDNRELYRH